MSIRVVKSIRRALQQLQIEAPFFLSQNDGTLMTAGVAERYPVLTFASGPTNSMRGAAFLSGATDALVADIGGTTTDIGMLTNGFPAGVGGHGKYRRGSNELSHARHPGAGASAAAAWYRRTGPA